MEAKKKKLDKTNRPTWPVWSLGVAGIVLSMFGVGYVLGWFQFGAASGDAASTHAGVTGANSVNVASLSDLLPGLEAKVAANPLDANLRRLLAQTYTELGQHDKGVEHLRVLHKQAPSDNPTTILLATSLMQRGTPADLNESYKLLEGAVQANPAVAPMARLYQGDIKLKLGDVAGAVKIWKGYIGKMSAGDPRRAMFEEKIAQASGKQ